MKASNLFQQTVISLLALGVLIALLYTNTLNHSELENKLRHLSKQANLLNLKINQTVLSHQLGIKKNYDLLSQQLTELKSIQQALKQLEGKVHRLNHQGITEAFKLFNQQVDNKAQLIESFKTHHALYNSALHFWLKRIQESKPNPTTNLAAHSFILQLQQAIFQNSAHSTLFAIDKAQLPAHFINTPLLKNLAQQAQRLIMTDNITKEYAMKIYANKTVLAFAQLEQEISLHYRQEHKKYQTIENILFLFTLLSATYITLRSLATNRLPK